MQQKYQQKMKTAVWVDCSFKIGFAMIYEEGYEHFLSPQEYVKCIWKILFVY